MVGKSIKKSIQLHTWCLKFLSDKWPRSWKMVLKSFVRWFKMMLQSIANIFERFRSERNHSDWIGMAPSACKLNFNHFSTTCTPRQIKLS